MDRLTMDVEVARSTGHVTASNSPISYPDLPVCRQTSGALAFQIVQTLCEQWPVDVPFNRLTVELIQSYAADIANTVMLNDMAAEGTE